MPDGLTVNEILKIADPDGDGVSDVSRDELRIASGALTAIPIGGIEGNVESIVQRDVSPSDIQNGAQAFLDIADQSFGGDLDATVAFLKDTVDANPDVGNVDFADAVNSGRAADFIEQTRSGALADLDVPVAGPPSEDEQAQMHAAMEAASAEQDILGGSPTAPTETPSTLESLEETFRANESVNESGFAEGIVIGQKMPNMGEQFGNAAPMPSLESEIEAIKMAQTAAVLETAGMDVGAVLSDGKIEDYEFAQTISKAGYQTIEGDPDLNVEDFTQENHPEAYDKAREFGESMNLDLNGHPEIVIGLMAVEVTGNGAMMDEIMEAQNTGLDTDPTTTAQQPDVDSVPAAADPAMVDNTAAMKI